MVLFFKWQIGHGLTHKARRSFEIADREVFGDADKAAGLTMESPAFRNRIVNNDLQSSVKSSPAPLYFKDFASRITTGNFEDDFQKIKDCDLVLEAVVPAGDD